MSFLGFLFSVVLMIVGAIGSVVSLVLLFAPGSSIGLFILLIIIFFVMFWYGVYRIRIRRR